MKRRDGEGVGRRMLEQEKKEKTKEEISRCAKREYLAGWCNRGRRDQLWRHLKKKNYNLYPHTA